MSRLIIAVIYGLISGFSSFFGSALCFLWPFSRRVQGIIMGFGSGALIASVSFGLMEEGFRHGGIDATALGLAAGAGIYYLCHLIFLHHSAPKGLHIKSPTEQSGLKILFAAILDSLPEQFAVGVGVGVGSNLGLLVMFGSAIAGIPEAMAGTSKLAESWRSVKILAFWLALGVMSTVVTVLGYLAAGVVPGDFLGFLLAFAAGSVLAMLSDTMLPEALKDGGNIISLATVAGFMLSYIVSRF